MTAAAIPGRSRPARRARVLRLSSGRLLRLELRRSAMIWMVPLAAVMFWFDTYRASMQLAPLWSQRAMYLEEGRALLDFAPFVAGAAAWAGSRDGRRGTRDQVAATALPRWAAGVTAWAATTGWALGAYLGCVAALYGVTGAQGAAGGPLWWPVAVGAVGLTAFSALGFAAGMLFPGRFTVPLSAIIAFLALSMSQSKISHSVTYGLVSPTNNNGLPGLDAGVFYRFAPDLSVTQIMFLAGLAVTALGALGLPGPAGRRLRAAAVAVTAAGLALAGTGLALAGTARLGLNGAVIPALHSAADDRPVPFTPVCAGAMIPVCVNPAYRAELPALAAVLRPVLSEVSGLHGAVTRVTQVPQRTPVFTIASVRGGALRLTLDLEGWSTPGELADTIRPQAAAAIVTSVVGTAGPAQQAVAAGLLTAAGVGLATGPPGQQNVVTVTGPAPGTAVHAAARRFAAQPAAVRRAWLATHLAALRSGRITLRELP